MKLRQWLHHLLHQTSAEVEPTIDQRCDRQGHSYYHMYDPATRKSSAFGSAQEIRMLLDQHRY